MDELCHSNSAFVTQTLCMAESELYITGKFYEGIQARRPGVAIITGDVPIVTKYDIVSKKI